MQEDRPPRRAREPRFFGLVPRERAYLVLMGVCLLLIVLAWTLIWRYSTVAAVAMSAVALVIPPVAAIIGNAGPVNRQ
jgi:Mg/Co/Ni transporter MgtE